MKRTMKKGFTLIELLAVIVILAVIALIAVPVILNIINKANKSAFKDTAYGIISAGELYFAREQLDLNGMSSDVTMQLPDSRLELKGKVPSGTITITKDGDIAISVSNGRYCATKGFEDKDVTITDGDCTGNTNNPNNIVDDTWPIEWNTLEVMNNTSVGQFVKVSNLIPSAEELKMVQPSFDFGGTIFELNYVGGQNVDGAEMAVYVDSSQSMQFVVISVPEAREYSIDTDTMIVPEAGLYVIDFAQTDDVSINIILEKVENPFPIEWNTLDVVGNVETYIENVPYAFVKVSDKVPTLEQLKTVNVYFELDGTILSLPYASSENSSPAVFVSYSANNASMFVISVPEAGEYSFYGIPVTFREPGLYAMDASPLGDIDLVIGYSYTGGSGGTTDADDQKENAYALILDNSADSENAVPMIFVREDEVINVGDTYVSETYGALEVTNVYTDFENTEYYFNDFADFNLPEWFENSEKITSIIVEDKISPISTSTWFMEIQNSKSINLNKLDTSKVKNMSYMFYNNKKLTSLDLSNFNTSNVTNMLNMFNGCSSLTSLDLSNFNTSNVTNMLNMFNGCSSLTSLNISSFNTSKVTDMSAMFSDCEKLTTLNVSNFNTSNVISMNSMFANCSSLTNLNVSNFVTSNVTDMAHMFSGCSGLTSLNVSNFNTNNVTNMNDMFGDCEKLTTLNVSNFNTSNVTDMGSMFSHCYGLTSLDLSRFNTSKVTSMSHMFYGNTNLKTIYASELWNVANVGNESIFYDCTSLVGAISFDKYKDGKDYANYTNGYLTYKAIE